MKQNTLSTPNPSDREVNVAVHTMRGTSTYKGNDSLQEIFLELLHLTFMALSETKLLERCVWQYTGLD